MALFLPSSFLQPSLSSPNNQNTTNSHPKTAQFTTVRVVPFCVPSLSTTSSPITPILKLDKDSSDYSSDHLFPSLSLSNILFFKSAYNVQVIAGENEPEEKLIGRFRREVLRAGVIQESKRRRFFESTQEKKKRKSRDAARRNRKRKNDVEIDPCCSFCRTMTLLNALSLYRVQDEEKKPQPKTLLGDTPKTLKVEGYKSDEDMWDLIDVESPYT